MNAKLDSIINDFFPEANVCYHAALLSMKELLLAGNPKCDLLTTLHYILQTPPRKLHSPKKHVLVFVLNFFSTWVVSQVL
jgi:hypothetical protein